MRQPDTADRAYLGPRACLLARGFQTKQMARALGISAKTADRQVQNAYAKMGVSTRAAATLFAMQQGLVGWGELPIVGADRHP
ncbi:hypothetical protein BH23ACT12_BH23ACT12_06360 [soil metagenome]